MIGIVGIGAAGGNIADLAFENGINAVALNFSERDLESLDFVEERLMLIGSEGVGKIEMKLLILWSIKTGKWH
ncbi:hypothetical protein F6Y02_39730 (plasmid) [Bacillus megaterium]|nr:hypothetical protein [Priestia megaterium]